jgi:hypothetical protein
VLAAIEALPNSYTIYAHNGGKFDFLFLIHKLRGPVSFKGRGLMTAKIGPHELRDSFHIIPERLANLEKEKFDYANMAKDKRNDHREEIISYCIADCVGLLKFVKAFLKDFGFKLSIGQAAMARLKQHYKVASISSSMDKQLRDFFFGGRVECLAGRGHFHGHYKLYDVNSMYPRAMEGYQHPIGAIYNWRVGEPDENTFFIDLECDNNNALVRRSENNETTANVPSGRFLTTIHEYRTALKLGLISNIRINFCIDCEQSSNFADFVIPLYKNRLQTKDTLKAMEKAGLEGTAQFFDVKKDDVFYKLLLNNAYGKFAQNPRRFKESYITDPGARPELTEQEQLMVELTGEYADEHFGNLPAYECDEYSIWERPSPSKRFNNVGTAASITGAARAILMEAIYNAVEPIYCDTDSLICRELPNTELHDTKLGAWDLEAEYREVIVNGKKMYGCLPLNPADDKKKTKIRSKGTSNLTFADMVRLYQGDVLRRMNPAPTLTKSGAQYYVTRNIRATVAIREKTNANQQQIRSGQRARA